MKIVAIIPARMASVRYPGKILSFIHGLPIIEHVRRRALLSQNLSDVIVATCDNEIASVVNKFGGNVVMTSDTHKNGTSRASEIIDKIDCTHVIVLQGDEPLLLPRHVDSLIDAINKNLDIHAWNATAPIEDVSELDKKSFVKCAINHIDNILYCFRRSPCISDFTIQKSYIRKLLGIIAYRKDFLIRYSNLSSSLIEKNESIEQMRIIENGYSFKSVPVEPSLPSINVPEDTDIVLKYIENNYEQKKLLDTININQNKDDRRIDPTL